MAAHLFLPAPGEKRRPPPGLTAQVHLDEPGRSGYPLHHDLRRLLAAPHPPPEAAQAFLLAALMVWAADKLLPRREAPDAWTREIVLHLPVAESFLPLIPDLASLLNFLTGDHWTIKPRPAKIRLGMQAPWPHPWRPQAVVLFSGGLDSLTGAIDLLEEGRRLVLVSHYDFGQLASVQQDLAAALKAHYGSDRVHHLGVRVQFPEAPELTLRSRSLLYLSLGLATASAFGPGTPVLVPENGWISRSPMFTEFSRHVSKLLD